MIIEHFDPFKDFNKDLTEGILYNQEKDCFEFDFDSDTVHDAIQLSTADITFTQFFAKAYIYGYQLRAEGTKSSKLVSGLKDQMDEEKNTPEIKKLVDDALIKLHKKYNLNKYKCIVYPDTSKNRLTEYIIVKIRDIIYEFEKPTAYYSIIKNIPSQIEFDWTKFKFDRFDLYTRKDDFQEELNRQEKVRKVESRINNLLTAIHNKDYFKLHESGFTVEERKYLRNFLILDEKSESYATLQNLKNTDKVLLVDDTLTSGTTMNEMIRAISVINPDCDITIFTLIKGKDGKF